MIKGRRKLFDEILDAAAAMKKHREAKLMRRAVAKKKTGVCRTWKVWGDGDVGCTGRG
jgi:hypothetical protein